MKCFSYFVRIAKIIHDARHVVLIDGVMSKRNVVRFLKEDRNARRYKSQVGSSTLPSADHKSMTVQLNVKWLLADGKKSDKERKDRERKMKRKKTRLCSIFKIGCRRRCLSRGVGCATVVFFSTILFFTVLEIIRVQKFTRSMVAYLSQQWWIEQRFYDLMVEYDKIFFIEQIFYYT